MAPRSCHSHRDDEGSNITAEGGKQLPEDEDVNYDSRQPRLFFHTGHTAAAGREFNDGDAATSPKVAVVSESMAKHFFPGRNPIGMHFAFGGGKRSKPDIEIVGVVKDVKQDHVRSARVFRTSIFPTRSR